jgi:hypothetical protein
LTPLKSKVSKILKSSIDDPMVLGLVEPLLLSMSDTDLRQMLEKVRGVIDEVLVE